MLLAFFFACIAVLCYQYLDLEYWTGLSLGSPSQIGDHDEDHNIFIVVDIPGKGKGIVAARDIKVLAKSNLMRIEMINMTEQQGELVIRERPLFVVPPSSKLLHYENEMMFNWNHSNFFPNGLHIRTSEETWTQRAGGIPEFVLCEFPRQSRRAGLS